MLSDPKFQCAFKERLIDNGHIHVRSPGVTFFHNNTESWALNSGERLKITPPFPFCKTTHLQKVTVSFSVLLIILANIP